MADQTHCGFVALIGAPNAGKSTLLNRLVGSKLSIVSPKPQTTRMRVLGIAVEGPAQAIFVDTPGIFSPRRRLDRAMVAAAWTGAKDADALLLVVDSHHRANENGFDEDTRRILDRLKETGRKTVLALNKIDLIKPELLLGQAERFQATGLISEIFMISAATGDGVEDLKKYLSGLMPAGPWLYPEDQLADMPLRLIAAEITREKLFHQLRNELPYSSTIETEQWTDLEDGSVRIDQTIYVERESQRAIVLGKGGQRIKTIGAAARAELEAFLERRVHLFLWVKQREDWAEDPERYRALGLDYDV